MDNIPLSWTRDVLRFSLSATASSLNRPTAAEGPGLSDPGDPGKDPRFRKLVEAVLFSRRLLATYNATLFGILLIFTAWHWGEKYAMSKRRGRRAVNRTTRCATSEERIDEAWSSSSSTLEGTLTPPDASKKASSDETTPLLATTTSRPVLGFRGPYYMLKSFLQYQPPRIPIVNKTLPQNSVSLFILSFLALNLFYNLYGMPLTFQYIFVFADRCGLLFASNLPLLYLLAAKNQPIKFLTGYSYESLNIFHRRVGELLCFEAFLHFLGMVFVWYGLLRHLGITLLHFLFNRLVGLGLGAFISYELLYFTSLGSFRQRWYEIFLASHIFLHIAALVLLWLHYHTSRIYVGIALAIFVADRVMFRLWLKTSTHPATLNVLEDEETVLLSANWDISNSKNLLMSKSMKSGWKANDHIFLTVPSLSKKHILQTHPFTIFSAAPEVAMFSTSEPAHAWFSLLIRAQNDSGFTRELLTYARSHPTTRIRLDGPYGSSHALDILEDSDNAIVVAGGSGIAVAYPLLWALLQPNTDVEPGVSKKRKVRLVWIIHSASHRSWVPEDKMKELQDWGLRVFLPAPTSESGRPNIEKLLSGWVEGDRTGIVVSGPDGLVRDTRNTCARLIAQGQDVRVQVEKFGW